MRATLSGMARNIWLVYFVRGLTFSSALIVPNIVMYLRQFGIGLGDFFVLEAAFAATLLAAQLPAGALADRMGRRASILLGSALLPISMLMYLVGRTLFDFVLADMLGAVGFALVGGPTEALMHDSLRMLRRTNHHTRLWGRAELCAFFGMGLGNVIGGALSVVNDKLPFVVAAAGFLLLGLVAFSLREPVRTVPAMHPRPSLRWVVWTCLIERPEIRWSMLFPAILLATMQASFWMYPDYLVRSGFGPAWNGLLFASFQLTAGVCSRMAARAEKRLGLGALLRMAVVLVVVGFAAMSIFVSVAAPAILLLHQAVRGYLPILMSGYLNRHVPRQARATALGLRGLCNLIIYTAVLCIARLLIAVVDMQIVFAFFAGITLVGGMSGLLWVPREEQVPERQELQAVRALG